MKKQTFKPHMCRSSSRNQKANKMTINPAKVEMKKEYKIVSTSMGSNLRYTIIRNLNQNMYIKNIYIQGRNKI